MCKNKIKKTEERLRNVVVKEKDQLKQQYDNTEVALKKKKISMPPPRTLMIGWDLITFRYKVLYFTL